MKSNINILHNPEKINNKINKTKNINESKEMTINRYFNCFIINNFMTWNSLMFGFYNFFII